MRTPWTDNTSRFRLNDMATRGSLGRAVLCLFAALVLTPVLPASAQEAPPSTAQSSDVRHIVIGLDLSKSNPLVEDRLYAAKVARRIGGLIRPLAPRSKVTLRTFGVYDSSSNNLRIDRQVSRRWPAETGAEIIEGVIAGVPQLVAKGTLKAQDYTNILGFLDNVSQIVSCGDMPTIVVLASDGIEDSEFTRLIEEQAGLPAPAGTPFAGCESLQILGLGQGLNRPSITVRLRGLWGDWAKAAGFKSFLGLNNW